MSISYRRISAWTLNSTAAISSLQTPWKFAGSAPLLFLRKKLNSLEVSLLNLSFPCKGNARALKRNKLSLFGSRVLSSSLKQLTEWFLNSGFGNTVSLQPMGSSLSNAAKVVTFVSSQNFNFVLACSLVHNSITSMLLSRFLTFVKSSVVATSLDLSNSVLFSSA